MEKEMLAQLTNNIVGKKDKLAELFTLYDLNKLGYEVQESQCNDVRDKILKDNEFFVSRILGGGSVRELPLKIGDRILNHNDDWLMSDEDFDRYQKICVAEMCKAGLTNEKGFYTEDWLQRKLDSWNELVDYIINEILPDGIRKIFKDHRYSVMRMNQLVDITRPIVGV